MKEIYTLEEAKEYLALNQAKKDAYAKQIKQLRKKWKSNS